jgi:hypothetical protein
VLCPEDYAALVAAAAGRHRAAAADAAAAAAAAAGGAPAAAAASASAVAWAALVRALRDVTPGAPREVLQAHVDLLTRLATEWRVADQEAVRAAKADLLPFLKACIQELSAAGGSDK